MRIYTGNSSRFHGSQIQRIEEGFRALGHETTDHVHLADLVFVNNPWFDQIVKDRQSGAIRRDAKVILNVQDLPKHIPDYDVGKLATQLKLGADAVTSISVYTRDSLRAATSIDSTVIFQPIIPVLRNARARARRAPFPRFASVGRRSDPNKRHALAAAALQLLGYTPRDVVLVGNEPGWGDYLGVQSEQNLNVVYNSVDFVLCTSRVEGLCLPVIEAMACGAIPVVCNDMTTREELLPPDLFPEYNDVDPTPQSVARFIARLVNGDDQNLLANLKERLYLHFAETWADRVSGVAVAKAILDVHGRLL